MIRIVSLTQKNRDPFFEYLPQIARDMAEMQTTFAIGAVAEEKEKSAAAGILLFSLSEKEQQATLQWIYTGERFRGLGIGDRLMEAMFDAVPEDLRISCSVPPGGDYDGAYTFLKSWGFSFRLENLFALKLTLEELRQNKILAAEKDFSGILPLSDLPSFEWNVLSPLLRQHDLVTDYRSYDHQMSCFQKEGDRIVAMLLTRRMPSGSIFPVFLRRFPGTGTGSPAPLLSFSLKACKSLPPEIPVYIRCTGTQSGKVLDILFPEKMPALVRKGSFSI